MPTVRRPSLPPTGLILLALWFVACSGEGGGSSGERSDYLDTALADIVADALSEKPSAEFTKVRNRVSDALEPAQKQHLDRVDFSETTGAALVKDRELTDARRAAARALGARLDPEKEADASDAGQTLATMLEELSSRHEVYSCGELRTSKVLDCVVALLLAEVKRCERDSESSPARDSGIARDDAGMAADAEPAGDAAQNDAGETQVDSGQTVALIGCEDRDMSDATNITAVTADQTWSGKILISAPVRVSDAKLTIAPGTVIVMASGASLTVGYNGAAASIFADGTAENPIRFCGRNANAGFWNGLFLESSTSNDSRLRNVLISDGGSTSAALVLRGAAILDNVQVRNSGRDGVWAADFAPNSTNLTVEGSGAKAVVLNARPAVSSFPMGGSLLGNSDSSVHLAFTNYDQDTTLRDLGVPYVQDAIMRVTGGTITFEAGVQYQLNPGLWLEVGYNNAVATIHANGTAAAPVVFSGVSAQPGGFDGIHIYGTVQATSTLSYVQIKNAGGDTSYPYALIVDSPIVVDHVTVSESAGGVSVTAGGFASTSTSLTVTGITAVARRPLSLPPDALPSIPPGSSFVGNATNQVNVLAGTYTRIGTIPRLDVPYFIAGNFRTGVSSQLTIAPGVELIFNAGAWLEIAYGNVAGARLVADGTAEAPIRFSGVDSTAGSWAGVFINANAASTSSLRYVEIGQAGGNTSYRAAIYTNATIPIENCRIYDSASWGISKLAANTLDYANLNTFLNVASGGVTTR